MSSAVGGLSGSDRPMCKLKPLHCLSSGVVSLQRDFNTRGWLIGTMCAVALLTLVALIACFVRRNKGGKYAGTPQQAQRQDVLSLEQGQLVIGHGWIHFNFRM